LRRQAPAIGEHTAEVLAEIGLAQNEIDALRQRAIVTVGEAR
jgi:crotonobetainyl-CoA:carnitine CoA-transferase CaiB-like acyl-CoA transferase